jgi:hypothetical protein
MASASAADNSANMPTVNPYLHNSHNPISHENPAQTDAVDIASGTKGRTLGMRDAKVLYTDIETSHNIIKNFGKKQVAYFSGAGVSISKVDVTGESFELIHRTMLPGHEAEEKRCTTASCCRKARFSSVSSRCGFRLDLAVASRTYSK